jgi:hypothetical protein
MLFVMSGWTRARRRLPALGQNLRFPCNRTDRLTECFAKSMAGNQRSTPLATFDHGNRAAAHTGRSRKLLVRNTQRQPLRFESVGKGTGERVRALELQRGGTIPLTPPLPMSHL